MSAPPDNQHAGQVDPNQPTAPLMQSMSYNQQPYNPAYQNPYPNQQQYQGGPPPPGFNTSGNGQNQGAYFPPPPPMPHGGLMNQAHMMENGQSGQDGDGKYSFQFSDKTIRAAFVRKVFTMVFIMLSVVAGLTLLPWVHPGTMRVIRHNQGIYLGGYVVFLSTYIALTCCEGARRKFPINLIVTAIFTFATGIMTMVITAHHDANVILLALSICVGCTLLIVVFASQTKFDMTANMGYIMVASVCFMMFGLVAIIAGIFFKIKFLILIYALAGSLLMMLYLFLDVQLLMGGRKYEISPEDYIFAAVQIFIDIIQLFWYLLTLFGSRD